MQELKEVLKEVVEEWDNIETLQDEASHGGNEEVLRKTGQATTDLIRKVIRDGMDTREVSRTEDVYKYNEYMIMDTSWGQYVEGGKDETKTIFEGLTCTVAFKEP